MSHYFTCTLLHGCVRADFASSTILPIPKKSNANCSDSENYRGIALSSIFCKIFDNIVIDRFHDILVTSEHQFGFKRNSSTSMCTMILKEAISYYVKNNTFAFCTFLDASKAFDRVNYCKLFKLLINRGLPAIFVRFIIKLYTASSVQCWLVLFQNVSMLLTA
jgi:hypothetical protein